jgi:hypothetical protein
MTKPEIKESNLSGEKFFKISNNDMLSPFLMSIVSDSDHWMFISSNGGLTAGRKNANFALFPYYTDDKLSALAEVTGSKSLFWVTRNGQQHLWEPFSLYGKEDYRCTRNLYKNLLGNKVRFEEINHDLELSFSYQWSSSNEYGFVRESFIKNLSTNKVEIKLVDGIQNIVPAGVEADLEAIRSNLVNAYKRSELVPHSGIGIFALSAIIVDRAEPSEALRANICYSLDLDKPSYLLSSRQLDTFRQTGAVEEEKDIKAEAGSYFVNQKIYLDTEENKDWTIIASINQNVSDIIRISDLIINNKLTKRDVIADIKAGDDHLRQLVSSADGLQKSSSDKLNARHYSNTLFNIMRGGIFDHNYTVEKWDFSKYLEKANLYLFQSCDNFLDELPEAFSYDQLIERATESGNNDLIRLSIEYLPLKFSRRHGDPSRPWNKFSINTRSEDDGSKILDYEGNWRDIFQNWEALAFSFPKFIHGMIFKFLNASTFDGYNPYRVTKDGFDWEVIEEHDPWSYIGYWGDHQIIYLQKFLEILEAFYPGELQKYFNQDLFVYANVPYRIKEYDKLQENPKDTIIFDHKQDIEVRRNREKFGSDGALLSKEPGNPLKVNLLEKLLATSLAKISNLVPEGGIWMNTQRPEWNDANNALVGNGLSMVTLYYLHRFFVSFEKQLAATELNSFTISSELHLLFTEMHAALTKNVALLNDKLSDKGRKEILDSLAVPASRYREKIYEKGFDGTKSDIKIEDLLDFCKTVLMYLRHSIEANRRADGMYHAYNLLNISSDAISISYLDEMLEGQVAVLSSGYLKPKDALEVLNSMKGSALFRPDQYSYLLYPNKDLPGFMERNRVPQTAVESNPLLKQLIEDGNTQILQKDVTGTFHFNPKFRNAQFLNQELQKLAKTTYKKLVAENSKAILDIYESVFNHKAFTGRSGTFYGYEGLGSIYWHMVSKLLLAVGEVTKTSIESGESQTVIGGLLDHFYEIHAGLGIEKSPELYGAFTTDPYSHTPATKGAQQPGMTGQVKEDILSRWIELGVKIYNGQLVFDPHFLRKEEFLQVGTHFDFDDLKGNKKSLPLGEGQLAFLFCQTPIVYSMGDKATVKATFRDGSVTEKSGNILPDDVSQLLISRSGEIERIDIDIDQINLK